jgi:imidazolonepropionase-like amidohydrolase
MKNTCFCLFGFILFGLLIAAPVNLNSGTTETGRTIVFKDARVFDGERILPQATVVITDGRIAAVGEKVAIPPDAEIISGKGKTLLPGLIDAHVHVWDRAQLRQSLVFGVTTVVDMFTSVGFVNDVKKAQAEGQDEDMAHMISPGTLITAPGGHGTQYGVSIPTIKTPAEAREFVDARIAEGSAFIKIIVDDGRTYGPSRPTISKETMAAVIKAAHARGKPAVVHCATLQNAIDALNAGADGLAHLYFDNAFDPNFGRLAAEKKAFVIPTFSVLQSLAGVTVPENLTEDLHLSPYLNLNDIQSLGTKLSEARKEANYQAAEKALRQLKEAKVPLLAGTDAGNPGTTHGASLHRELELLVQAGLTPLEALRAATSTPAKVFKLEGRGRIQPGMTADLVLVNGDPIQDIKATRNIAGIWKDGKPADRTKYLEEATKEREARERRTKAPPPEYAESGLISDFEGEKIEAGFGAGWMVSTDAMMGGKSKAEMKLVDGGAQGSKRSLLVTGTDVAESAQNWAGVMFCPGANFMAPANLSFKKSISFWAQGDGKKYACLVFAQSLGWTPAIQYFTPGPEWKEFVFPYEAFKIDGSDIMGIFIGASGTPGDFVLQIDEVRLK